MAEGGIVVTGELVRGTTLRAESCTKGPGRGVPLTGLIPRRQNDALNRSSSPARVARRRFLPDLRYLAAAVSAVALIT